MYSNDFTQIRGGLVNYIGSALNAAPFQGKAGKQYVFAMLIEEAIKLAQEENGDIDLYTVKPLFRGCKIIFDKRKLALQSLPPSSAVNEQIAEYDKAINVLNGLIENIQE